MNAKIDNYENLNELKKALINWENELLIEISKNSNKKELIYLMNLKLLDKYFSKEKMTTSELAKFNEELWIDNKELSNIYADPKKSIKNYPKLFPLNNICLNLFNINNNNEKIKLLNGTFHNKILLLKLIKYCYCFFFADSENQLRQGYFKIKEANLENNIITILKKNGIFCFIEKKNVEKKKSLFIQKNEYEIYISEYNYKLFLTAINNNISTKNIILINQNKSYKDYINNAKEKNNKQSEKTDKNKLEKKRDSFDIKNLVEINPTRIIEKKKRNKSSKIEERRLFERQKNNKDLSFEEFLPSKAIHKRPTPGIIGLLDVGATCYMNAIIQCFSNITRLRNELLNKDIYEFLEKNKNTNKKVSFALAEILKNLWINLNHKFFCPEHFKEVINEMNPLFKETAANNPENLVLFLLENLHNELNFPQINNINIANNQNYIIDNNNLNDLYNNFYRNFFSKNKSIITNEFYGFLSKNVICGCCKNIKYNIQVYNILFFPLEEIRKYKGHNFNIVNIYDCFDYYSEREEINIFHCYNCNTNNKSLQLCKLLYCPHTIIINLNRGKGLQYNVNIVFEEYLNLKKYIYAKDSPYYYELIGVICIIGSNDNDNSKGGHFIAYCKNSGNCGWYKYNDQNVSKTTFTEVKQIKFPYILIYSYIKI